MADEAAPQANADAVGAAKDRVHIGAPPVWIRPLSWNSSFKAAKPSSVTYLLLEQQANAETRERYIRSVTRLETMEAVQRHSQWRLQFEPRTQSVTLNTIKVWRGETAIDHCRLDKIHFLQRESGLEGFVIDGWYTMLLLLEDIRPGDVIESAYTVQTFPILLPDKFSHFFTLPIKHPIARYEQSARFQEGRGVRWKSSLKSPPVETTEAGSTSFVWSGEKFQVEAPEDAVPSWHLFQPWIQVSDHADWSAMAGALASVWRKNLDEQVLAGMVGEILAGETDPAAQVEKILRYVQDEFRYFSSNIELGGHIPTPPEVVLRRRFGDCKDLSYLLAQLLKQLGLSARPVLVSTGFKKTAAGFLPPGVFNHVVVEYQFQGKTRWVDPTIKYQGGGSAGRFLPDYGSGLPVDDSAAELITLPAPADGDTNQYSQVDTILLNTSLETAKGSSYISVLATARGLYADNIRREIQGEGVDSLEKRRLQDVAHRFGKASRMKPLQFRDDRDKNEFTIAEVFQIDDFVREIPGTDRVQVVLVSNHVNSFLALPGAEPRKMPLALAHPCHVVHTIRVDSNAINLGSSPALRERTSHFEFSRSHKNVRGRMTVSFSFRTLADAVLPEQLAAYRKSIEKARSEAGWVVQVPTGYRHLPLRRDFGDLPAVARPAPPRPVAPPAVAAIASNLDPGTSPAPAPGATLKPVVPFEAGSAPRGHRRRRHRKGRSKDTVIVMIVAAFILLLIVLGLLAWNYHK